MVWKKILLEGDAAVPSDTAPVDTDFTVASAGVATDVSRQDHKHDLNEGVIGTLKAIDGTAKALGTDNAVPHLDHIHALGPLVANLDFAKHQATSLVLDVQATAPLTPVAGQVYHNSVDGHPYVYVT
jgi:hypothetical protein